MVLLKTKIMKTCARDESKFSNACCKNGDGAIQVVTLIIVTQLCEIVTILVNVQLML
jgi:hypothetical protein